jgi:hypothetical protein
MGYQCEYLFYIFCCVPLYIIGYIALFLIILIGLIFAFVVIPPISIMILLFIERDSFSDKIRISNLFEKKEDVRADPTEVNNYFLKKIKGHDPGFWQKFRDNNCDQIFLMTTSCILYIPCFCFPLFSSIFSIVVSLIWCLGS